MVGICDQINYWASYKLLEAPLSAHSAYINANGGAMVLNHLLKR